MFTPDGSTEMAGESEVFYSRRSDGPYYRWWQTAPETWRVMRVHDRDFTSMTLCNSSWKNIPAALQNSVINHYEE